MKRAQSATILTVRGEKTLAKDLAAPLRAYLAAHAIEADVEEFEIGEQTIGTALLVRAAEHKAEFLVMGGYGHSRLREFVLGGATRHILSVASLPILMAH